MYGWFLPTLVGTEDQYHSSIIRDLQPSTPRAMTNNARVIIIYNIDHLLIPFLLSDKKGLNLEMRVKS
jgi:hypothetical protein